MYVDELRQFRTYLQKNTVVDDLRGLNLLGVQVGHFWAETWWVGLSIAATVQTQSNL